MCCEHPGAFNIDLQDTGWNFDFIHALLHKLFHNLLSKMHVLLYIRLDVLKTKVKAYVLSRRNVHMGWRWSTLCFHSGSEAADTSTTTKSSTKKYSQAYVFVNIIQRNTM